jgi:hypothetical protein
MADNSDHNLITNLTDTIKNELHLSNLTDNKEKKPIANISREFAGMMYCLCTIVGAKRMEEFEAVTYIREFYESDTGEILHSYQLKELFDHKYVKEYAESIKPNIEKKKEKYKFLCDEDQQKLNELVEKKN